MHYARKYFSNTIKMLLSYSLLYGDKNKLNDYIYKYIYIDSMYWESVISSVLSHHSKNMKLKAWGRANPEEKRSPEAQFGSSFYMYFLLPRACPI